MNLVTELEAIKEKDPIAEVNEILLQQAEKDLQLLSNCGFKNFLQTVKVEESISKAQKTLGKEKLYTYKHIEKLCLKYGLYFREVELYRGQLGSNIISDLRDFIKKSGKNEKLIKLYISAPASQFENYAREQDPLLFAKCDGDSNMYYLVSQWGGDISWSRRFLFRILPLSLIASLMIPITIISYMHSYLWMILSIAPLIWFLVIYSGENRDTMRTLSE